MNNLRTVKKIRLSIYEDTENQKTKNMRDFKIYSFYFVTGYDLDNQVKVANAVERGP